ncbi:hypothetical protein [Roseateles asaccharophilus]|uniref:Uncharacterized protein n=1 Tax=Roseateles asaccharophilus TaxID=582607 RepID=A0ABU2AFQ7_9BURK|nr:hypothetical protein [Roseateles asaccharophilus]MDR7336051.1 hypothetical protein [Roseateles asaccharophilus]
MVTSLACAAARLCMAALNESRWLCNAARAQGPRLPTGWRA